MTLKFVELRRAKKNSNEKRIQREQQSKRIEYRIDNELREKLKEYLETNDRVMLEINSKYVGEFLNILDDSILSLYDYEQVDKNKFIFYNKELEL